uniref:Uncharacterized protein n=1 Tax=Onchocerca volvulus TaxID=6282 RepID=A0A8R1XRL2_ONCVO
MGNSASLNFSGRKKGEENKDQTYARCSVQVSEKKGNPLGKDTTIKIIEGVKNWKRQTKKDMI